MRTPVLVAAVVAIHVFAIGAVMFIQGCGTKGTTTVEPPPAPVMPPRQDAEVPPPVQPVFKPPVPVEPAPSMMVPTEGRTYVVQKGDVLSKIASKLGVSARELADLNNIKDVNKIRVGQKLLIPDYAASVPSQATAEVSKPKAKPAVAAPTVKVPEGGTTYVVQSGDNLTKIAKKHGVKISALREANQLKGDRLLVGQKLAIPGSGKKAEKVAEKPVEKKASAPVVEAPKPVVAPVEPMAPIAEPSSVPAPAVTPPAEPKLTTQDQPLDYTVQEGDTVESIAKLFIVRSEDIMALNGITDAAASLQPGQKLKIPTSPGY